MNYAITFVFFFIFLLCQYAIWITSNVIAKWVGVTGQTYWCIVIVAFLILNELCFGAYDFDFGFDDEEDDDMYDWLGDEDN